MTRYILKRLVLLLIIILFVSVATFFLVHLLPGNPATTILGPNATPQNVATVNKQLGLNKPIVGMTTVQGGYYLSGSDGGVFSFPGTGGVPPFFGSTGSITLNEPIVGIAS